VSALRRLEEPCPTCGRTSGDHTLREWSVCIGETTTDVPFATMDPDDAVTEAAGEAIRRSFNLPDDYVIADHVVAKALTLDGATGPVKIRLPALLHEFQVGRAGAPPVGVAKVLYAGGSVDVMRQYGRLIRDTANGAANAAERGL
jgi:hypothetical protein